MTGKNYFTKGHIDVRFFLFQIRIKLKNRQEYICILIKVAFASHKVLKKNCALRPSHQSFYIKLFSTKIKCFANKDSVKHNNIFQFSEFCIKGKKSYCKNVAFFQSFRKIPKMRSLHNIYSAYTYRSNLPPKAKLGIYFL